MDKKGIIVLGVHRSGTSALAAGLEALGVSLGNMADLSNDENPKGFFENRQVVLFNDRLLVFLHGSWDNPLFDGKKTLERKSDEELLPWYAEANQIFQKEFAEEKLWGIKDPRMCQLLPFWQKIFSANGFAGDNIYYLHIIRHPLEVALSLERRVRKHHDLTLLQNDLDQGTLLWFSLQYQVLREVGNDHNFLLDFEHLLESPEEVLQQISRFIGFDAVPNSLQEYSKIFLEKRLKRNSLNFISHVEKRISPPVAGLYHDLRKLAKKNPFTKQDVVKIIEKQQGFFEHFERVASLAPLISDHWYQYKALQTELQQLLENHKQLDKAHEQLGQDHVKLNTTYEQLNLEHSKLQSVHEQMNQEHSKLQSVHEQMNQEHVQLKASHKQLNREYVQLNRDYIDLNHSHKLAITEKVAIEDSHKIITDQGTMWITEIVSFRKNWIARRARKVSTRLSWVCLSIAKKMGLLKPPDSFDSEWYLENYPDVSERKLDPYIHYLVWGWRKGYNPNQDFDVVHYLQNESDILWSGVEPYAASLKDMNLVESKTRMVEEHFKVSFFTICSRNFLAYAKTLYFSLKRFYPNIDFYVALCDEPASRSDALADDIENSVPFSMIYLDDLDLPEWREMSARYNITEFNTSIKPFVFKLLFNKYQAKHVVYLDPDIYAVSRFYELEDSFATGVSVILTPHLLCPAENAEMNEKRLLQYGIYNLGFLGLTNTKSVNEILDWWGRQLITDCVIKRDEGLFVDQKWCDHFPAFIDNTLVLQHPGYNVAYWNLSTRKVSLKKGEWRVNDKPICFVHFSGLDIDDKEKLSRHSSEHTPQTIGDLRILLEEYREEIDKNGHEEYRKLPYAFSWLGASGENEHTPSPGGELRSVETNSTLPNENDKYSGELNKHVKKHSKKLLYIDGHIPRSDRDSGSRTAFGLVEVLQNIGYEVSFLATDLAYDKAYILALENIGVRCYTEKNTSSVDQFLADKGMEYDFVILSRILIIYPYFDLIKKYCSGARTIFNTVDLHYIREEREAKISGSEAELKAALETKKHEMEIIDYSDETIVLSEVENEILKYETPNKRVRVLPLLFTDIEPYSPGYSDRKDLLFIGSFPHLPNIDAVLFFAKDVFPKLREKMPDIQWHIVGSYPPPEVLALSEEPGIIVHGFLENIKPIFRSVRLSVVPLRYGAGIKGKIAMSFASGVPVVASTIAAEGMNLKHGIHVELADTPDDYVESILKVYDNKEYWQLLRNNGLHFDNVNFSLPALTYKVAEMMHENDPKFRDLSMFRIYSKHEFDLLYQDFAEWVEGQREFEKSLMPTEETAFTVPGYCEICDTDSHFVSSYQYSLDGENGAQVVNWREHLSCDICKFNMRQRGFLHLLINNIHPKVSDSIYLTEQVTPLFKWMKQHFPNLTGSEYLGDEVANGATINGIRSEDLTQLSFEDESFDYILSLDVLEHVTDDLKAFSECFRCLKPGGTLYFTAPFSHSHSDKVILAEKLNDGEMKYYREPEYHGNPVNPEEGSLCYRYFAWDVLDDLLNAGFESPHVIHYWSKDYVYFGPFGFCIVAKKPDGIHKPNLR